MGGDGRLSPIGVSPCRQSTINTVHDRLESPADRLLLQGGTRSSYVVLPLFALANAGVVISTDVIDTHLGLVLAVMAGLVIGKPLGMATIAALAVWTGIATKPDAYSWRYLIGATALAGIGFTMSLFVAGQAADISAQIQVSAAAVFANFTDMTFWKEPSHFSSA